MSPSTLDHLNTLLRDHLGVTRGGSFVPTYKWIHSRDRELFVPLEISAGVYESYPQIMEERWVLAMWMAPPSEWEWKAQFQGQIGYPRNGYYVAVDTPCDPLLEEGAEPNERMTLYIIGLRKKEIALGLRGLHEKFKEATARREHNKDRITDDFLSDKWTAFGNVPGRRGGHVSFGGI